MLELCGVPVKKTPAAMAAAAAIPAAHAFFLERGLFTAFSTKDAPPSWRDVVNRPELHFSFADTVFGALRIYDWSDLLP